jgi:hypothetical protein
MSRYLSFAPVFVLFLIVSCQKETSFEQGKLSQGSLQDSLGDCLSKTVVGTYTAGKSLADSNFIDVTVNVTQPGRYTIYTDTVNGYYFKAAGTFSTAGTNTVRLKGAGTPGSAGNDDFFIFYDSSFCNVSVTVLANAGSSGGTAAYTLQDSSGNCMSATVSGTYTQGVALTSSNKVDLHVNVTSAGTWNITTTTVAGFSFSGSGTFTATGVQTITLTASGTPTASGDQIFPVTAGSSLCSFTVTVGAGNTPPASGDYFPLTQNSYWTYDDGAGSDTLKTMVSGSAAIGGKTYQRFVTTYEFGSTNDTSFYRKDNTTGFYYTYIDTSAFSGFGITFSQAGLDVLFLKNTLSTGNTWNADFNATFGGLPIVVRFKFTCTNSNASITANGVGFSNVYQISTVIQLGMAGNFTDFSTTQNMYYAKGIGLIKDSDPVNGDQVIRHWQVL